MNADRRGRAMLLTAVLICVPLHLSAADPSASFPEPTQFDPRPFAARLDDDALAVASSPDGSLLAAGCADGTVRFCDPATGRPVARLTGHADAVGAVAFSRDGGRLASASYDKTIRVWDVADRKEIRKLTG